MTDQQKRKQDIRAFMRAHYTDERLAQLLAHAEDGKLSYNSCCCFIGVCTADHPLHTDSDFSGGAPHFYIAQALDGAREAELAFAALPNASISTESDLDARHDIRRRILIPMIRAEMWRRERLKQAEAQPAPTEVTA